MRYLSDSFLACISIVLLVGCGNAAMEDPFKFEDSYQGIRERIIVDFANDPDTAEERYRLVFLQPSRPDAKDLVAKAVVCGQLMSNGMKVDASCPSILESGAKNTDDEVRSLAISAMAFGINEESQNFLIYALSDRSAIVRVEAAQALTYQVDILSADPNNPMASSRLRERLVPACRSHPVYSTSSFVELCRKVKQEVGPKGDGGN